MRKKMRRHYYFIFLAVALAIIITTSGCISFGKKAEETGIVGAIYHGNKWRWFFTR